MKKHIIRLIFAIIGAALGYNLLPIAWHLLNIDQGAIFRITVLGDIIDAVIGAIIFYFISLFMADWFVRLMGKAETYLAKQTPSYLLFGALFTILGLVLANVLSIPLYRMNLPLLNTALPIVLMIGLGYLGFRVGTLRRDDWRKLFQNRRRDNLNQDSGSQILERRADDNFRKYKILDTSVIIDGRIHDIAKTGFIEGKLLVPEFVVHELQLISDSADSLKRARGRRGLDILNEMKSDKSISVQMYDGDFEGISEVDTKLIKLAKMLDGIVVTNDYNLNKVSEFQNVPVLNINALANALKPEVLPGEDMHVTVVKAGTERQQGVAYQADGTMVVVEDGQYYLNKPIDVVVTSTLQTAAGRMIFARPVHQRRGIDENTDKSQDSENVTEQNHNSGNNKAAKKNKS